MEKNEKPIRHIGQIAPAAYEDDYRAILKAKQAWLASNTFANTQIKQTTKANTVFSVPLWRGVPLPDNWQGARLTRIDCYFEGDENGGYWAINLSSDFSSDVILLNLDADDMSRKAAMAYAETIMSALNTRRLG